MVIATSSPHVASDHHVHFFDTDAALSTVVADYLSPALVAGDAVVVVATEEHRNLFSAALAAAGVDVHEAVREGRLWLRDAADMLASFSSGGALSHEGFRSTIGGLVHRAAAGGRPVRIYGEMVALLWDAGDVGAAMELERLWNELGERVAFGLFCAYPSHLFVDANGAVEFAQVCGHHAHVVDGAPVASDVEVCRRFPMSAQTPRLARCFVSETLEAWGFEALTDAALLVVAELAANAVLHAESDVSVGIARLDDAVRLVVGDTSDAVPASRAAGSLADNGRGLLMVDNVAGAWGHTLVDGGKLIWVDLAVPRP
jgi:hypothetical protein